MSAQQPEEHSPALDGLYEALTEVQAHLGEHDKERQSLLAEIESTQRELLDQRQKAAQAGERDTYNRLSEDLAKLTRAYRVASEDPNADPLGSYQWDDSEPQDQPPQEADDGEHPDAGNDGPPDQAEDDSVDSGDRDPERAADPAGDREAGSEPEGDARGGGQEDPGAAPPEHP